MKILVLGHARHGKDTVAEMLRDDHGLKFRSSSMYIAESVVRPALAHQGIAYPDLAACYADRGNHRALWYDIIAAYNAEVPDRLCREILAVADVYVGMRRRAEYEISRPLFDAVLWVDASRRGVPLEGRDSFDITFNPAHMIHIDNGRGLRALRGTVAACVSALRSR